MITVIFSTKNDHPTHIEHIRKTSGMGKNIEIIQLEKGDPNNLSKEQVKELRKAIFND